MSETNMKPDPSEPIPITESYLDDVEASSAANREHDIRENGMQPVSLWVFLTAGLVILVAGSVLGKSGSFSYNDFVTPNYVQSVPAGGADDEVLPKPIMDVFAKNGAKIYQAKCQGCHQPNGLGDGANYPPIGGSEWVTEETSALAQIILNGVAGPIQVAGKTWNGAMPAQAAGMTDADLAALMTYIRNAFGNETGDVISIEMASNALDEYKKRGGGAPLPPQVSVEELEQSYMVNLEGAEVNPMQLINPETLEPAQ